MQTMAVIGTGISGMSAGYFLRDKFDITFYEKEDYAGGHTNTLTVKEDGQEIFIDSAFMVYNEPTYPLLTRLFKELGITTRPASMSFSVQHLPSGLEYCASGYNGLFAQRRNIFNPRFVTMLLEIDRFRREADEVLDNPYYSSWTLAQYIGDKGYSTDFLQKFLVPMSSAVWSTPADTMLGFPVQSLVRFFKNHRFLSLDGQLSWRTCAGGSRQYRDKIMAAFAGRVRTACAAVKIKREEDKVCVTDSQGKASFFDKVIIACHADEALNLLADPTRWETALLGKFAYVANKTTLHTDGSVMPRLKNVWSSWNYRIQNDKAGKAAASTVYWMNSLQGVSKKKDYFISINDPGLVDPQKILWERIYTHPLYTVQGQEAQLRLAELNQNGVTYFCGAYFRYGFHEDGLSSGLDAARAVLGGEAWP